MLQQFADIYTAFAQMYGYSPAQVREMELWEMGEMMRKYNELHSAESEGQPPAPSAPKGKRNLAQERLAFARGEGPEPQPDESPPDAGLMQIMHMTAKGG